MAYLAPLADNKADERTAVILEKLQQVHGSVPNLYRTLAHAPDALVGVMRLGQATHKHLPAKYRELAYLMASRVNQCEYCIHYHTQAAMKHGITLDQIDELNQYWGSTLFDDVEKAVLRFADELTRDVAVEKDVINQLKAAFDEPQLVELAITVGMANLVNRVNEAFKIELP